MSNDQPAHALSRYTAVTERVIEKCQQDYRAGRDMGRSIPGRDATWATLIAIQSSAADALFQAPPEVLLTTPLDPLDDWSLTVLADILFSTVDQMRVIKLLLKEQRRTVRERAWAALEQALDSPTTSPLVWYEDIFFDVAEEYRMKRHPRAINVMKRGLAHNLRHNQGNNLFNLLPDLAETYLWLGELDRGLAMLTALLRNDPANIWTYNLAAITFDHFGLADLGLEAAQRGLDVLAASGDPEGLHDQLRRSLADLRRSKKRGREAEVDPTVLADFRAALALDLAAGLHRPLTELCHELIPDLDQAPVKGLPPAPDPPPQPEKKRRRRAKEKSSQARRRRTGKKPR